MVDDMNDKPIPCPFCGSDDTDANFAFGYEGGDESKPQYASGCMECGAAGPHKSTAEEAMKAWDTRAPINESEENKL